MNLWRQPDNIPHFWTQTSEIRGQRSFCGVDCGELFAPEPHEPVEPQDQIRFSISAALSKDFKIQKFNQCQDSASALILTNIHCIHFLIWELHGNCRESEGFCTISLPSVHVKTLTQPLKKSLHLQLSTNSQPNKALLTRPSFYICFLSNGSDLTLCCLASWPGICPSKATGPVSSTWQRPATFFPQRKTRRHVKHSSMMFNGHELAQLSIQHLDREIMKHPKVERWLN